MRTFSRKVSLAEITELTERLAGLEGLLAAASKDLSLSQDVTHLQREKVAAELELVKVNEQHARENREIEHKIGLHKKQVEHDIKVATQEAKLEVREENLGAQQERFATEMKFTRERFEDEVKAQRVLLDQILSRLPTVNVDRVVKTVEYIGEVPALGAGENE